MLHFLRATMFKNYLLSLLILAAPGSAQEIALTFDDAPTQQSEYQSGIARTEMLIKKLRAANVSRVAFFVVTSRMDSVGKARLKLYSDAGHIIANHSHSHNRINRIGVENYIGDIFKADLLLNDFPGFKPWFRFPFLDEGGTRPVRDAIRKALADKNYSNGYVTVDNYDWYLDRLFRNAVSEQKQIDFHKLRKLYIEHLWRSLQFYDNIALKTLGRSPKHVLLLHENDLAALFIDDLVKFIRKRGWRIISPVEAYQDAIAKTIPDVLLNNQGRVAAIAKAIGYSGRLSMDSESTQFLDELFKKEKVFAEQ